MKRLVPLPAMLAMLALTACDGPMIPADTIGEMYDFRLPTEPPSVLRWPSGTRVRVHVASAAGARMDLLAGAFAKGAAEWNRHALYGEYELVRAASVREADVLVRWSDEPAPVDLSGCQPVVSIAVTTFCLTEDEPVRLRPYPLQGDGDGGASSVRFVITILGGLSSDTEEVEDLVMHELGHALGIARHSPHPDDLMTAGSPPRSRPSLRDIATVQILYHSEPDITP